MSLRYDSTLMVDGNEPVNRAVLDLLAKLNELYTQLAALIASEIASVEAQISVIQAEIDAIETQITNLTPTGPGGDGVVTGSLDQASSLSLVSNTNTNIASIALTNGLWDVTCGIGFSPAAATSVQAIRFGAALTNSSLPSVNLIGNLPASDGTFIVSAAIINPTVFGSTGNRSIGAPAYRLEVSSPFTLYLNINTIFTLGAFSAWGWIQGRRVLKT